jgi:hypothetical protein
MATVEELEREVANLKSSLTQYAAQCALSISRARRESARAALAGMGVSGVVFGLAGYLLGSRNGMRRARELMK